MKTLNKSKIAFRISILMFLIVIFIFNYFTYYTTDDYRYLYCFPDSTKRIENIVDIVLSMCSHAITHNGRVVAHFFVQLFLMLPKVCFDIVNSIIYVVLVMTMYRFSVGKEYNLILLWSITASLWFFTPSYGQVFLWLDGSCNYLWAVTFCLLYIMPFHYLLKEDNLIISKRIHVVIYILLGIIIGAYSETASLAAILFSGMIQWYCKTKKKLRLPSWVLLSTGAMISGYIFMILTPGTRRTKTEINLSELLDKVINIVLIYKDHFMILLGVLLVLLAISFSFRNEIKLGRRTFWFFGISLMTNFVHCFASYYPERSMLVSCVFMLMAVHSLLFDLYNSKIGVITIYSGLLICLVTIQPFVDGGFDIWHTYEKCMERNDLIEVYKDGGELNLQLPLITVETKYSAKYGLKDLDVNTPDTWPNKYMAEYYGVNTIIGIEE